MEPRLSIVTLGVRDFGRAFRFYAEGLGFPTKGRAEDPIAVFVTAGTRLAIYPLEKLAEDVGGGTVPGTGFGGITLAHNVRRREEVAEVLALAERAGGTIVKPAQDASWGGHSGYFRDPDGYPWEVAWNPHWPLDETGSVQV